MFRRLFKNTGFKKGLEGRRCITRQILLSNLVIMQAEVKNGALNLKVK